MACRRTEEAVMPPAGLRSRAVQSDPGPIGAAMVCLPCSAFLGRVNINQVSLCGDLLACRVHLALDLLYCASANAE